MQVEALQREPPLTPTGRLALRFILADRAAAVSTFTGRGSLAPMGETTERMPTRPVPSCGEMSRRQPGQVTLEFLPHKPAS